MADEKTVAERFRSFAVKRGTSEDDPHLGRAVEALRRFEMSEATAEEVDAAVSPLFVSWYKAAREAVKGRAVMMASESNSLKAMPLRRAAKESNIAENDPLLVRALLAQEKADPREMYTWIEMEIAVWAFLSTHFESKWAWPRRAREIEYFLQKLEHGILTPAEVEGFRRLAIEIFNDWEPQYSPGFRRRIEEGLRRAGSQAK
jgi:hypothetical protein